ncbi:cytochrome P450 2C15 [Lingula anatina]|uniref:Cytochrome P450 2C15 n=1 Tax=Lingula anatina TaxID=7574 RepID=A0A1S3J235_LINAN|nr:cytochrome P450 2C15 [Lingula anatina]|eukprot:XP_013404323.1 cytochrome P450 2C15 [Lingula anatina]
MANIVVFLGDLLSSLGPATVLVFVAVLLLSLWALTPRTPRVNWPPGPFCFPMVGCLPQLIISGRRRQPTDLLPWYDTYGDIMHIKIGEQHMVILGTKELQQEAFVKKASSVSERPLWVYIFDRLVGKDGAGVIMNSGHAWKELRRFTLSSFRDLGVGKHSLQERIQDEARYLVQSMEDENGNPFSPRDRIGKAVSNIISIVVFGTRWNYDEPSEMLTNVDQTLRLLTGILIFTDFGRVFTPTKKIFALVDRLRELIAQELERHRQTFDPNDIRDFIDLFIKVTQEGQDPEVFTEKNFFRTIADLYMAGTDTTANTLRWSLVHMVNEPHVQKKVQQEINEVIGQGRVVKMEDKIRMPYTEATILEVFRMSPVAPFGVAHATSESVEVGGYTIPKGTIVIADQYRILHDKCNFEDPYQFKPERWLDSSGKVTKSGAYIPFSTGPRVCLGKGLAEMEAFIFFTTLMQNFVFKVPNGEKHPNGIEGINTGVFMPYPYNVVAVRR